MSSEGQSVFAPVRASEPNPVPSRLRFHAKAWLTASGHAKEVIQPPDESDYPFTNQ